MPFGALADIHELARLDELEALAETGGVRRVEAGDRGLRLLVPAVRRPTPRPTRRGRRRRRRSRRSASCRADRPSSGPLFDTRHGGEHNPFARGNLPVLRNVLLGGRGRSSVRIVWNAAVRATIRSVESSMSCSSLAWSARSATVRTSVRARAVSARRARSTCGRSGRRHGGSRRSPRPVTSSTSPSTITCTWRTGRARSAITWPGW